MVNENKHFFFVLYLYQRGIKIAVYVSHLKKKTHFVIYEFSKCFHVLHIKERNEFVNNGKKKQKKKI